MKLKAFCSLHSWRHSLTVRVFLGYWLAVFSIIWTFTEFTGYFFTINNSPVKPSVWLVLGLGVVIAAWMSRPRLTRTILLPEKDIQLQVTVDDMFRLDDASLIIPSNCCFTHDHIDGDAIITQFRSRFFSTAAQLDQAIAEALRSVPAEDRVLNGRQVNQYPIGTVAQIPLPGPVGRFAYLVASAELNEHGRGIPQLGDLKSALNSLWTHIGERGNTRPLAVPVLGSGRQRLTPNRLQLIALIMQSFLSSSQHRKFTGRLTVVIHPRAYLSHSYNLDEVETYMKCLVKFNISVNHAE
ncbi:macro domain-containing protein [Paenibacillus filicis]|uniref:macro domain-containing protein n=1 Tax=Paenibacillus filicis TaxID=669464 RepID=UPI0031197CCD